MGKDITRISYTLALDRAVTALSRARVYEVPVMSVYFFFDQVISKCPYMDTMYTH